jgi:hypothetical protein
MSDLDLIKQFEDEIGEELEKRDFRFIMIPGNGYAIDEKGNVIGMNMDEIKLVHLQPSLSKLRHLKKLSLHNTQLTDISFLQGVINLKYINLRKRRYYKY